MNLTKNYSHRTMAGEYVLMPQGEYLLSGKCPIIVNETASDILARVKEGMDENALLGYLISEYGFPDAETAEKELAPILGELREQGVLA